MVLGLRILSLRILVSKTSGFLHYERFTNSTELGQISHGIQEMECRILGFNKESFKFKTKKSKNF